MNSGEGPLNSEFKRESIDPKRIEIILNPVEEILANLRIDLDLYELEEASLNFQSLANDSEEEIAKSLKEVVLDKIEDMSPDEVLRYLTRDHPMSLYLIDRARRIRDAKQVN